MRSSAAGLRRDVTLGDSDPSSHLRIPCGGGIRAGQAIGATNRLGEYAQERPVPIPEIVATLYHNPGIDVAKATVTDPTDRPQYLVEAGPHPELIS